MHKLSQETIIIVKTLLKDIPSLGVRTKQLLEREASDEDVRGRDIGKTAEQEEAESQAAKHGVSKRR